MKSRIFSLLIVGGAISFAACQGTGDGTTVDGDTTTIEKAPGLDTTSTGMTTLDDNSRDFVLEVSNAGLMEVELGQLAQQKATHPRVKEFGAMMVRDHSKANEELKTVVDGKLTLPATLNDKHQGHVKDLTEEKGKDFDKDYIKMMVDDHETTINKFENIAKETNDPALRNFANNTLPALRAHLDSAKAIRNALK